MYCIWIFSNKLDLNQEASFYHTTIYKVYETGGGWRADSLFGRKCFIPFANFKRSTRFKKMKSRAFQVGAATFSRKTLSTTAFTTLFSVILRTLYRLMEQRVFFAFWLILEGTIVKMLQLKSVYNKNFGFIGQKLYFWTLLRGSN
jgi:hypothetical protein